METSKRRLPFSGHEEPRELKRMAVRSDEKIHFSATSQSDDLRKISLKMLNVNGGDWQEEVYQKIKAMKELYLHDLNDLHHKLVGKLQQHDSIPQQPKNEPLEKLKVYRNMLERFIAFLQIPKQSILANYKDKLGTYEKQIANFINTNRRKPGAQQVNINPMVSHSWMGTLQPNSIMLQHQLIKQQEQLLQSQQLKQFQQFVSNIDSNRRKPGSAHQTRNENGGDWQEEVYQKIKAMRDLYLHDMNDLHRKLAGKLKQYDSLPQQPKNELLEKLKVIRNMLERFMAFLQIPKQNILASYKEKLGTYEKQIVNVINSNRRTLQHR